MKDKMFVWKLRESESKSSNCISFADKIGFENLKY